MTDDIYFVRGCTALLDAVGGAIHHIGNIHKYARDEDRPEKTLFIITTDGMENANRRYTYKNVKKMVERQKEKYGWEFLFLGANMDAIAAAGNIGIHADRAVTYQCDGGRLSTMKSWGRLFIMFAAVIRCLHQTGNVKSMKT